MGCAVEGWRDIAVEGLRGVGEEAGKRRGGG